MSKRIGPNGLQNTHAHTHTHMQDSIGWIVSAVLRNMKTGLSCARVLQNDTSKRTVVKLFVPPGRMDLVPSSQTGSVS